MNKIDKYLKEMTVTNPNIASSRVLLFKRISNELAKEIDFGVIDRKEHSDIKKAIKKILKV